MDDKCPNLAFYTRWLYSLGKSKAALHMMIMRLYELENEALAEQANRPPQLIYVEDHLDELEVKVVDLPGVIVRQGREFVYSENGVDLPVPDYSSRTWIEVDDDGQAAPVDLGYVIGWARERAERVLHDDRALTIAGTVGIVVPAIASALLGDAQLALLQARAGAVALGVVSAARMWRGG